MPPNRKGSSGTDPAGQRTGRSPSSKTNDVKIALLVVDGLAMDQWLAVRGALASRQPGLRFREQEVFAWIPSLSTVSRQAAFTGKATAAFQWKS